MFDKTDLQSLYLAKKLAQMEESGELQEFVDFARNEMKKPVELVCPSGNEAF